MNRSESINKISAALHKAQSEMGSAVKGSANPFFKSKYADLNAIREAVLPALNKNGITVLQPMKLVDGRTVIETVLLHESGEWLSSETPVVVSKQNDPQAEGSGQSYARRYGLQSFLNVGAEDDDGEAGMGRGKTYSKPTYTATKVESTPSMGSVSSESATLSLTNGKETLPLNAVQASAPSVQAVEPVKKSSFRKPPKKTESVNTEESAWE